MTRSRTLGIGLLQVWDMQCVPQLVPRWVGAALRFCRRPGGNVRL